MKRAVDWLLALLLLAAMSFSVGCGSEPDHHPAPPRPDVVAVREVCTVTLNQDGSASCVCEVAE